MLTASRVKDLDLPATASKVSSKASKHASKAGTAATKAGLTARDAVEPYVGTAGAKLSDGIDVARQRIVDDVAPAVVSAAGQAREISAPVAAEALTRAGAAVAALKGEQVVAKAGRRWPLLLLGLGLGTALGVLVTKFMTPPPAPTPYPTDAR